MKSASGRCADERPQLGLGVALDQRGGERELALVADGDRARVARAAAGA